MKNIILILAAAVLAGCAGTHPRGLSRVDEFDAVKVDQMVGNNISPAPLQRVIVCLNARRESRPITALTNVSIRSITNAVVMAVTNETITVSTNYLATTMTNVAPALGAAGAAPISDEAVAAAVATVSETPAALTVTNVAPAFGTNITTSIAQNSSATAGPSQRGANHQIVRTFNNQITTTSNNLSVSLMTNLVVTMETNAIVNFVTNYFVSAVTNLSVVPTNATASDYYVYTEVIPPPDFTLQPAGESLILLVDGVRHGLSAGPAGTSFQARRGFSSAFYRVAPDLLVAIANAREVRLRLKGTTSVIERSLNSRSRENFKAFLVRHFAPETQEPGSPASAANSALAPSTTSTPGALAHLP